jgi:hypothetical protein
MWKSVPNGENLFRDMYQRKIIGMIGTIKHNNYVFEPNHSYDVNRIANEVLYLMNQSSVRPKEGLLIRHVPTNSIKTIPFTMKRLKALLSCIHHMNEDAVYEVSPPPTSPLILDCPLPKTYSFYVSLFIYMIAIVLLCILSTHTPYVIGGLFLFILLFFI